MWGERHKRKDTNPNKNTYYEFTGFIKCGQCGANYRCQANVRKDGTRTRSWYCTGPRSECSNKGIRDETMKALVTEALDLDAFDESVMDAQIEYATVINNTVTFHFRDGHTVTRPYLDKRHGVKWTAERRERQVQSIRASWTEERRKRHGEIIREIRRKKRGESNDDTGNDNPVHSSTDQ